MMMGIPSVYYGSEFGITGEKGKGQNADIPVRPCLELDDIPGRNEKLLQHIAALGAIRKSCEPIQYGSYSKIELKNQTFIFKREANGQNIYIALNISDSDYIFNFSTPYSRLADRLTGKRFETAGGNASITVSSNCSMVLVNDEFKAEEPEEELLFEETAEQPIEIAEERDEISMSTPSAGIPDGRKIVLGGHYKHFKGGDYVVLNVAKDHETLEEQVVYMAIYDKPTVWVRPLKMFLEDVDDHGNIKPRFQLVQD
jgi:hypothetical protein